MITTIINGIMVDAESIVEVHAVTRRYNRYEMEEREGLPKSTRPRPVRKEDDTLTQIMREVLASIEKGQ